MHTSYIGMGGGKKKKKTEEKLFLYDYECMNVVVCIFLYFKNFQKRTSNNKKYNKTFLLIFFLYFILLLFYVSSLLMQVCDVVCWCWNHGTVIQAHFYVILVENECYEATYETGTLYYNIGSFEHVSRDMSLLFKIMPFILYYAFRYTILRKIW